MRKLEGVSETEHLWWGLLGEGSMMFEDPKLPQEPSKTSPTTPAGAKCIKAYIQSIVIEKITENFNMYLSPSSSFTEVNTRLVRLIGMNACVDGISTVFLKLGI